MPREQVPDNEEIVRGITSAHYDPVHDQISSDVFCRRKEEVSVNRLAICTLKEIFGILRRKLEKPGQSIQLLKVGQIQVGFLKRVCVEFKHKSTPITIEADPEDDDLSHAVIPQRISDGLAKEIIRNLNFPPEP